MIWYDQYRLIFIRNLWFYIYIYVIFFFFFWFQRTPRWAHMVGGKEDPHPQRIMSHQNKNKTMGPWWKKENSTAFCSHSMGFVVCISLYLVWTRRLVFLSFPSLSLSLVNVVCTWRFFLFGFQTVERKGEWMWKRGKINKDCTVTVYAEWGSMRPTYDPPHLLSLLSLCHSITSSEARA